MDDNVTKNQEELSEEELREIVEKAENVVALSAGGNALAGAIPLPFADMFAMIGVEVAMLTKISQVFQIDVKKDGLKALVMSALGIGGATVVGKTIAGSLFKMIPGAGTVGGALISGGTSAVVTLAMGKAFIEVCKAVKSGKLSNLTSKESKDLMKAEFKKRIKLKKDSGKGDTETENKTNGFMDTWDIITEMNLFDFDRDPLDETAYLELRNLAEETLLEIPGESRECQALESAYEVFVKRRGGKA